LEKIWMRSTRIVPFVDFQVKVESGPSLFPTENQDVVRLPSVAFEAGN
jgi:hypothetical protein